MTEGNFNINYSWLVVDSIIDTISSITRIVLAVQAMIIFINGYKVSQFWIDLALAIGNGISILIFSSRLFYALINQARYDSVFGMSGMVHYPNEGFFEKEDGGVWGYVSYIAQFYFGPGKLSLFADSILALSYYLCLNYSAAAFFLGSVVPELIIEYGLFLIAPELDMPMIEWEEMFGAIQESFLTGSYL